ncbi:MAG: response regulator [Hyphomicrobiaceae bacterium]|nr:response regulator [Hyphomicrobiaceae bacterium]
MKKRISVVDDDPAVIDSIRLLLQSQGFETDCHADATSLLASQTATDCILSDVRMPGMNGVDLMRELQTRKDARPIILLTGHGDIEMAVNAIKGGAFDFIEKPFDPSRLIAAIGNAINKAVENKVIQEETALWKERYDSLTDRQRETMALLVQGFANKEIATRLGISPRTVEIHRTWVMNKMAARTLAELVRMGISLDVV